VAKPNVVSKQDLLQSANQCIVRHGLQALTLKAVAEGANVTQGTVYYHFRNKEQLLLEIVQNLCNSSWEAIQRATETEQDLLAYALDSARIRCTPDSVYHTLFLSLVVAGFQNEKIRNELGQLLEAENHFLQSLLPDSPIKGVSAKTWAILLNAMIDGLALQALLNDSFSADEAFAELKVLLRNLLHGKE
jgi:AcrR family transcriptional regulator